MNKSNKTPSIPLHESNAAGHRTYTEAEVARMWERLLHEGNLFTNRINFYIVAQSMFFVAFASNSRSSMWFSLACAIAGIWLSIAWMKMTRNQDVIVYHLRRVLRMHCAEFDDVLRDSHTVKITHPSLGRSLPWIMIVLWVGVVTGDCYDRVHNREAAPPEHPARSAFYFGP